MKKFVILLPFVALFILPLLFYPGVDKSGWISNGDVHALLEFTASLLAITAGILVLLHFLTKGRWFYLIISTGFVLIGAEEFVHAIFSFNRIWSEIPPTLKLAISSTWLTGRFILSASFLTALIIGKREIVSAKRGQYAAGLILAGSICAASVTYLIFKSPFLPGFVQLGSITKKMIELSLALLFFVAFVFYVNFYIKHESRSPLLWSIIACIICQILVQLFVFNAEAFYDAHWDTAHLIVFLSYFFPIFGVWGETIQLHKTAQLQVIELGKEITERKRAEQALAESEIKFRWLYEYAPSAYHLLTSDGTLTDVNRRWCDLLGYRREEVLGRAIFDFVVEEEREAAKASFEKKKHSRQTYVEGSQRNFKTKDGALRTFKTYDFFVMDQRQKITSVQTTIEDITDRKRAEEALRKKDEHYRNVIESIFRFVPEGLLVLSEDFNPLKQNKAFGELVQQYAAQLGYTEQELAELITEQVRRKILSEDTTEIQIPKKRL